MHLFIKIDYANISHQTKKGSWYPMRVKNWEGMNPKSGIRPSWSMKNLRKYKDEFGLDDTQDLLAMVCIWLHGGVFGDQRNKRQGIANS